MTRTSRATVGILVLLLLYTLYFARALLLSMTVAVLLSFVLRPLAQFLERRRIPTAAAGALVVGSLLAVACYGAYSLAEPVSVWMQKAPYVLNRIESRLRGLRRTVEEVTATTERVGRIASLETKAEIQVMSGDGRLSAILLNQTWNVVTAAGLMFVLLYFLLASGDLYLRKLVRILPALREKKRAVEIARQIESDLSTYLLTVTLINGGLGVCVALAMALVGIPNPVLWGVMAAALNYIPYLGAVAGIGIVAVVGLLTHPPLHEALLPAAIYFGLTALEGYIITPIVLGRRLMLNPVVIFVGLMFWTWIWGAAGGLLAVPLLVTAKIICDRVEPLYAFGELLGR